MTREFPQHSFVYSYSDDADRGAQPANYPFAAPTAPPVTAYSERDVLLQPPQQQPYDYYQQQQQQQQYQYPSSQPPAFQPSSYYVPPAPAAPSYQQYQVVQEQDPPGFVLTTLKLILFHLLNMVLGIGAFVVVVTGASLSVGLIPLCCFGIVVFRVLLVVIRFLAQLDVRLSNFASDPSDRVLVKLPRQSSRLLSSNGHSLLSGRRLAPRLGEVSPLALMAMLYFATIKFALGIASCVAVSMLIAIPAAAVGAANGSDVSIVIGDDLYSAEDDPLAFFAAAACLFVIALALVHLVARLSCAATRFFCAEKFSMTQFHFSSGSDLGAPIAAPLYANTGAVYGSAGQRVD